MKKTPITAISKDKSRLIIEDVGHRLGKYVQRRVMMNDTKSLRTVCFDVVNTKRFNEYCDGLRAGLNYASYPAKLHLYVTSFYNKTYLFKAHDRDLSGWASYLEETPFPYKKYTDEQITTVLWKTLITIHKQWGKHFDHIKKVASPSMQEAIDACRSILETHPHNRNVRSLYVALNHPLTTQDKWTLALEFRKINMVHQ